MARALARLLRHPGLWTTAVRMGWRLRLFPGPSYMKFRMVTMYGDPDARPRADDLLGYLQWCKDWERSR